MEVFAYRKYTYSFETLYRVLYDAHICTINFFFSAPVHRKKKHALSYLHTHTQARARVRLVSPAHCVRIVVKRGSSGTDAIRLATASRGTPWTATPLLDTATANRSGEVC